MEILKISALALCAVILIITVKNYKSEIGLLVAIACSIVILYIVIDNLKYAFAYFSEFYSNLKVGKAYYPIVIKTLAIAYVTEFTSQLCKDSGETSVASKVELAGKIMIFCVSIPIFSSVFNLLESFL